MTTLIAIHNSATCSTDPTCHNCGFPIRRWDRQKNGAHFPDCGGNAPDHGDDDDEDLVRLTLPN